jgi:hypothetical protein
VIWLGPVADGSDDVMDTIARNDVEAMQSLEFADGYRKLLLRSWFYRTWIIQEFVLAKFPPKVVCRTKSIKKLPTFKVIILVHVLQTWSDNCPEALKSL